MLWCLGMINTKEWKVLVNHRALAEGCDYEWLQDGYLKFGFALGPYVNVLVKGPEQYHKELSPGKTPMGAPVNIPGAFIGVPGKVQKTRKVLRHVPSVVKSKPVKVKPKVKPRTDVKLPPSIRLEFVPRVQLPPPKPKPEPLVRGKYRLSSVYLDDKILTLGEDYEWTESDQLKMLVPTNYKYSHIAISCNGKKNEYFDVGKQRVGYIVTPQG